MGGHVPLGAGPSKDGKNERKKANATIQPPKTKLNLAKTDFGLQLLSCHSFRKVWSRSVYGQVDVDVDVGVDIDIDVDVRPLHVNPSAGIKVTALPLSERAEPFVHHRDNEPGVKFDWKPRSN